MASHRLSIAFGGTFIIAIVSLLFLSFVRDIDELPGLDARYQWADREFAADDSVFLLGAGKADITGYMDLSSSIPVSHAERV